MGERAKVVGVVATTEEEGAAAIFGAFVVLIGKNRASTVAFIRKPSRVIAMTELGLIMVCVARLNDIGDV